MNWDDLTEEQKDAIIEATANAVGGAYDCMRVWSAWSYGTMSEDDFLPVRDSNERLVDIARAVVESLPSPTAEMVPWEPRRAVPTPKQATAWYYAGHYWMVATVDRDDPFITRDAPTDVNLIEWCLPWRSGFPVSWAEVDSAVKAMEVKWVTTTDP